MRDDHHDIQTPKKDHLPLSSNRKAKLVNDPSKKLHHQQQQQKSIKKNLSSVFTSISEDDAVSNLSEKESLEKISSISKSGYADESIVEISLTSLNSNQTLVSDNGVAVQRPEESIGISPISEAFVFDKDQSGKSIESYILSLNQFVSPSSTTVGSVSVAETTPFSSMSTVEMTPSSSSSSQITAEPAQPFVTKEETEMDSFNPGSLVKHLRKSMSQVLHSADVDHRYKKLLDALVKMMIEEFFSFHEEKDMVVELFSKKVKTFLVSFVVFILLVSSGFILFSDVKSSYNGPPPT